MGCIVLVLCRYKLCSMVSQDLPGDSILCKTHLKNDVERGLRFFKDKSFRVAEIYLTKPSPNPGPGHDYGHLPVHLLNGGISIETGPGPDGQDCHQPDEETDVTADVEVDLIPVPKGAGIFGPREWNASPENCTFYRRFAKNTRLLGHRMKNSIFEFRPVECRI